MHASLGLDHMNWSAAFAASIRNSILHGRPQPPDRRFSRAGRHRELAPATPCTLNVKSHFPLYSSGASGETRTPYGGSDRTRTCHLLVRSEPLYPDELRSHCSLITSIHPCNLPYLSTRKALFRLVDAGRLELPTRALKVRCSSQLSYASISTVCHLVSCQPPFLLWWALPTTYYHWWTRSDSN